MVKPKVPIKERKYCAAITITTDQHRYLKMRKINLSQLIRNLLDSLIEIEFVEGSTTIKPESLVSDQQQLEHITEQIESLRKTQKKLKHRLQQKELLLCLNSEYRRRLQLKSALRVYKQILLKTEEFESKYAIARFIGQHATVFKEANLDPIDRRTIEWVQSQMNKIEVIITDDSIESLYRQIDFILLAID
jgi:DNA-binding LytR/AlgR family response regulator